MAKILKWAAIQIYYYLIAADGEILDPEMESFLGIAKETDPLFDQYKESLIEECKNQVNKVSDKKNRYAVLKEGIDLVYRDQRKEILNGIDWKSGDINSNMFIWNMLSIAMSDGVYAEEERAIVQYVVEKFKLDVTVLLELENAMKTMLDIDQSIAWMASKKDLFLMKGINGQIISSQTGSYIDEFANRREIIFNSIKETIKN